MHHKEIKDIKKLVKKYEEASEDFRIDIVMSSAFQFAVETLIDYKIGEKEKTEEFIQQIKSTFENFLGSIVSICDEFVSEDDEDEMPSKEDIITSIKGTLKELSKVINEIHKDQK